MFNASWSVCGKLACARRASTYLGLVAAQLDTQRGQDSPRIPLHDQLQMSLRGMPAQQHDLSYAHMDPLHLHSRPLQIPSRLAETEVLALW